MGGAPWPGQQEGLPGSVVGGSWPGQQQEQKGLPGVGGAWPGQQGKQDGGFGAGANWPGASWFGGGQQEGGGMNGMNGVPGFGAGGDWPGASWLGGGQQEGGMGPVNGMGGGWLGQPGKQQQEARQFLNSLQQPAAGQPPGQQWGGGVPPQWGKEWGGGQQAGGGEQEGGSNMDATQKQLWDEHARREEEERQRLKDESEVDPNPNPIPNPP